MTWVVERRLPGVQFEHFDAGQDLIHELDPFVLVLHQSLGNVPHLASDVAVDRNEEQHRTQPY